MEERTPKLFSALQQYSRAQLMKDVVAGVIVAIIALPLSIALALASGVQPEQGLYTAIAAGFVISLLGGSSVQIAGPTAAFATIVAGIVAQSGMDGLIVATILAGILLLLMGIFQFGSLIRFIPYTITTGFTLGIAITLVIGQLKDFLGITFSTSPIETMDKLRAVLDCIGTMNWMALGVGLFSLAILIVWPMIFRKIPASLIAVLAASALVKLFALPVNTIGDLYAISSRLPSLSMPAFHLQTVVAMLPDAITIAVLAAIESLLSCVVADGMVGDKHRPNVELVAQGAGNIVSALFGGIPATGAIARTAANIKNGGRTPVAGMVHSLVLLLILILLMPYAALIPMPTIAAILLMVAYNMSGWRTAVSLCKTSPKSDILVLLTTLILTVMFDLVVAIGVGLALACVLFMKRMADETEVCGWKYLDDSSTLDDPRLRSVPAGVRVFEIKGPMFFGSSDKFSIIAPQQQDGVLILRMSGVPAMDISALHSLESVLGACQNNGVDVLFSHVNAQPMKLMRKSGFIARAGEDHFCANIDEALRRAESLLALQHNA